MAFKMKHSPINYHAEGHSGSDKVEVTSGDKNKKVKIKSTTGNTVEIKEKTFKDALNRVNVFKKDSYKGTAVEGTRNFKLNDGTVLISSNDVSYKKNLSKFNKDKKLYEHQTLRKEMKRSAMSTRVD